MEINGNSPSALFLAGGGSKLAGLKDGLTRALGMDAKRVAIAGNNFRANAYSQEYDLNNPEYATPLGIVISSGLNLINDGFRVTLNDRPAKLFRSGSFTALNLLMMNGYSFQDIMGRPGFNVAVTVNGKRKVFYGTSAEPAALYINKKEGKLSEVIHAGDSIEFIPAVPGVSASPCLGDVEGAASSLELTLNGGPADLETPLKNGDVIFMRGPEPKEPKKPFVPEREPEAEPEAEKVQAPEPVEEKKPLPVPETKTESGPLSEAARPQPAAPAEKPAERKLLFHLNGLPIHLPRKEDGSPYYLMDMIQYSGIDLKQPRGAISLLVNGQEGVFQQVLKEGDNIRIEEEGELEE